MWRSTDLKQAAPYTSVMPADINSERQYIQTSYDRNNPAGYLNGFAAGDGKVLWSAKLFDKDAYLIASTALIKGNLVYQAVGDTRGVCHLFEIGKDNKPKELYSKASQKNMKCNHGGVVLIDDHVYGYSDGRGWACQDFLKGTIAWEDRTELPCNGSGTLIGADGMLYMVTDLGDVGLAKADPKEFNLVSTFRFPALSKFPSTRATSRSAKVWSYPAVANGYLYVRDCELIFCYDVRDKK